MVTGGRITRRSTWRSSLLDILMAWWAQLRSRVSAETDLEPLFRFGDEIFLAVGACSMATFTTQARSRMGAAASVTDIPT
ncbi:UNVERIFIED_ORG: hypothetical protein ABIB13_003879 [Arthrobacter sp. UYEF2]